jgi:hypothetical protein
MGFLSKGKKVEQNFAKLFKNVDFSSTSQDIKEHWDLAVNFKIDVKGLKKRLRSADCVDETIHWIEIKNVNGDKGWLYGEADYFAFELHDYWVIVDKLLLQEYIAENTVKEYSKFPMMNKLYKRNDRKDILTIVSTFDLIYISTTLIKKVP